jgi:DNA polymerase I-like protein with 3'-5' exonuclease and polymerase domains
MMVARISFFRRLRASGIQALLVSTVHDSIIVDCPEESVEAVVKLMYQVFDDLVANIKRCFGYDWKTPLACEVKIGMDLLNMKKVGRDGQ